MKQGTLVTKLVMFLLFAGVVLYLGAAAWQSFSDPYPTVMAYGYTVDDAAETVGYLFRQELVLPAGVGIVDIVPSEGEKVGAGHTVAVLYRDEQAMQRRQAIRSLELKLDQLEYSLRQEDNTAEAGRLDEEIFSAMALLRISAARHDYSRLDRRVLSLKSLVFRREYTHSGDAAAEIEEMMGSVSAEIAALQAAAATDTSVVATPCSGIYSGLVDGYEELFTPAALEGLTVSGLLRLTGTSVTAAGGSVGKLITGSRWYLAALLPEAEAARLAEGGLVTAAFSRDASGEVCMRIERISRPENRQVAVVLSSTRSLSDFTLLRKQRVDIVFARHTGIRVPKKALRVLEDGTVGVYAVAGAVAEFRKVSVVSEGEDFYLLASAEGVPDKRKLRAGDEIVVAAEALYDGKVVR